MRFCKTSFQFLQVFLIQWRLIISLTQILFPKYNLHNMVKTVSVAPSEVLQATKRRTLVDKFGGGTKRHVSVELHSIRKQSAVPI